MLSAGFASIIGAKQWCYYGLFAFFSTFAVYNGQRLFKAASLKQTPWLVWVNTNRTLLAVLTIISSILTLVALYFVWNTTQLNIIVLGISGAISFLYVFRLRGSNMREIPHLKIHLIAISWVAVLITFPMVNEEWFTNVILYSIAHYLYVLAVTIPFDIRDLKYDLKEHRTIPQVVGVKASKAVSLVLLIGFVAIMVYVNCDLLYNWSFYGAVLVQIALVLLMTEKRSDFYCAGLIDGSIALLGLSYFLI
ncbi:MAG: hypothetical protein HRT57_16380 [Crocinitomicaceae bacterium]|nr:hypothetical protein [Crocinitomicaceae bacterium]